MKSDDREAGPVGAIASSAVILDWHAPFAARVLSRLHEYSDSIRHYRLGTVIAIRHSPGDQQISPESRHRRSRHSGKRK
jgi:hypothetical protein